jgi:uncharacterized RDD family membrane protein YckC
MIWRQIDDADLTEGVLSRRAVAWLIDAVIQAVLMAGLWVFCLTFGFLTLGLGWGLFALLPVVPFAYSILSIAGGISATPGQAMCGLAYRRADDLGRPDFAAAIVATFGYALSIATTGGLVLLLALFTERHRALHDMAAGLVVVRRRTLERMEEPLTMPRGAWNIPG